MGAKKMRNIEDKLRKWPARQKGRKKIMLAIFPHPDDETMATGGLLMKARKYNWQTQVLILTRGEAGQNFLKNCQGSLAQIRKKELKKAAGILKIDRLDVRSYQDSRIRFQQLLVKNEIKRVVKKVRPEMVVTYDHSGLTGHPDHITVSLLVKEILLKMEKSKRPGLYWVALPQSLRVRYGFADSMAFASQPDYILKFGRQRFSKWRAARAHRSQKLGNHWWSLTCSLLAWPREWYHEVEIEKEYPYQYVDYQIK